MEGLFFTTSEDAEEIGMGSARIRHMVLANAISVEKRGRNLLIPSAEVERAKRQPILSGHSPKLAADGEVSTVTDAPDDDASSAATLQRIEKKATTKASKQ